MKIDPIARAGVLGMALYACGSWPAHAQLSSGQQVTVVQTVTTISYLNGGIGHDEQIAMRRVAGGFPLRIDFSERADREFLAEVPMVIANTAGSLVLRLRAAGPMLYVMLPDGRYTVSARFDGVTETKTVTLDGRIGRNLSFHWVGQPASASSTAAGPFGKVSAVWSDSAEER